MKMKQKTNWLLLCTAVLVVVVAAGCGSKGGSTSSNNISPGAPAQGADFSNTSEDGRWEIRFGVTVLGDAGFGSNYGPATKRVRIETVLTDRQRGQVFRFGPMDTMIVVDGGRNDFEFMETRGDLMIDLYGHLDSTGGRRIFVGPVTLRSMSGFGMYESMYFPQR